MKRTGTTSFLVLTFAILFCVSLSTLSFGQGYQVNLQGQVQQGMGSAGAAYVKDASILFYNPGGSSFLHSNEIVVGGTPTFAKSTFLEHDTYETANTTSPMGTPFAVYGQYQLKDSSNMKFGLAIYTPFGSTIEWEEAWVGRFALTRLALKAIFFQPTISYRIHEKLGIGAGFVYSYGTVNLRKDIPVQFEDGTFANAELDGVGHGFGYNVGIYYEPSPVFSFGVTFKSRIDMNVEDGTATFNVPASLEANFPSGPFSSSLPLPQVFTVAAGIKPSDKWAIALDVNAVQWSAYDTLAFDYETNTSSLEDTKSARNYKNTIAFRGGVEYKLNEKFAFRLGGGYSISPVQDGYVTPETPDANRVYFTGGAGYSITEKLAVDASVFFTQANREDTNLETGLSGIFKTNVIAPGLSLTYKF